MKKFTVIILIAISGYFMSCKSSAERIAITSNISLELPANYKVTGGNTESTPKIYSAVLNRDKITLFKLEVKGLDSMSIEKKKNSIQLNVDRFIQPFNGIRLSSTDITIGDALVNDFSFEFEKNDSTFVTFGRFIVLKSDIFILAYQTPKPLASNSVKSRDNIFNSLIIK
jgi:hypothetical protein